MAQDNKNSNDSYADSSGRTTMQTLHGKMCAKLYKKFGEGSLEIIREIYGEYGYEIGNGLRGKFKPQNLKDAAAIFFLLCEKAGLPYRYELIGEILHWNGYKCPFGLEGAGRPVCEAMMAMDVEMLRSLLGLETGGVELTIEKTLAAGDDCCQGTLRIAAP
jgi:hypothetical protein